MTKRRKRICPPDHSHGSTLNCRIRHKCECKPCVEGRQAYDRARRTLRGEAVLVPAGPTMRRLQALACHGWTLRDVASAYGHLDHNFLREARAGIRTNVRVLTESQVAEFYAKHAMTMRHGANPERSKRVARQNGWHSPLEWEDVNLGILG